MQSMVNLKPKQQSQPPQQLRKPHQPEESKSHQVEPKKEGSNEAKMGDQDQDQAGSKYFNLNLTEKIVLKPAPIVVQKSPFEDLDIDILGLEKSGG